MYGHLEGTGGQFAREPSGYVAIDAGVFGKHGLEVFWEHVQGTEERYRRLENGSGQISLVVGRAALPHFLRSRTTKILGCAMNSCPYYLLIHSSIKKLSDLKDKTIACRAGPARSAPLSEVLTQAARLDPARELTLFLPRSDLDAYAALVHGEAHAALLPRPYGFLAEEKGFVRIANWPDIIDDPLPITIETTEALLKVRRDEFAAFLAAHREGIRLLKSRRAFTIEMLQTRFNHSPGLAAKTFDEYLVCMNEGLIVDAGKFRQLLSQIAPDRAAEARRIAFDWVMAGALSEESAGIP